MGLAKDTADWEAIRTWDADGDTTVVVREPESVDPTQQQELTSVFSRKIDAFLNSYIDDLRSLDQHLESELDRFKVGLMDANIVSNSRNSRNSNNSNNSNNTTGHDPRMLSFNITESTYYGLIHSLRAPFLALSLLHYAKKVERPKQRQLAILFALVVLSMHLNVRAVALKIYLRMAINRLVEMMNRMESLDDVVLRRLKYNVGMRGRVSRRLQRSGNFLLVSVLTTLIVSLNEKIARLLPHVEVSHLIQYLEIYRLDLQDDDFTFVNLLNRPEEPVASYQTSALRPLRLHSLNAERPLRRASMMLADTPSTKMADHRRRLTTNPHKLYQQLRLISRLYLSMVLAMLESTCDPLSPNKTKELEMLLIHKFNIDRYQLRPLARPTRIYLAMKSVERTERFEKCLCYELQDPELNGYQMGLTVDPIAEDNEDEQVRLLSSGVESLAYKLEMIELGAQTDLEELRPEFEALQQLFTEMSPAEPVQQEPIEAELDFHDTVQKRKRLSSGLNFSLLTVDQENM